MSSAEPSSQAEAFARLAYELSGAEDFTETVRQVVEFARDTLGTDFAGVTLIEDGGRKFESVGATDPRVEKADRLQYEMREGPCMEAAREERTVRSPDVSSDSRWPRWGPAAAALGFGAMLSVELHSARERIGALNLYGRQTRQFSFDDAACAHLFAFHAGVALAAVRNDETLHAALDTRTLIGQAQGILMERFDVDDARAFGVLRRYSQDQNIKLHEVARYLVDRRSLPDQP